VPVRPLHTSHAFHTRMMETAAREFAEDVARVRLRPPSLPYVSNLTGQWITPEQATSPRYWGRHLRERVDFDAGIRELRADTSLAFLEVGPGEGLSSLVRQHRTPAETVLAFPSMRRAKDRRADGEALLTAAGQLWLAGVAMDWPQFDPAEHRRRAPLPTYPFERRRYSILGRRETAAERNLEPEDAPHSTAAAERPLPGAEAGRYARPNLLNPYVAPRNPIEERIAEIWQQVLGIEAVGVHDNFFELGGHSLLGMRVISRLQELFPIQVSVRQIIVDAPTVAGIAEVIERLLIETLEQMPEAEANRILAGAGRP